MAPVIVRRDRAWPDGVRDAEVDHVDELAGRDEDVARLDVAVHDAVGVGGIQRLGDLGDQVDGPVGRQRTALLDQRAEVGPVDQAHVDEQPAVDLAVVVDRDDVRLPQPRDGVGLTLEPALVLGSSESAVGSSLSATWRSRRVS